MEVRCGSLLPPFSHPVFRGWSREDYDRERRDLRLSVNGAEVMHAALACYDATPSDTRIGRLGWFTGGVEQSFPGEVLAVSRLPLEKPEPVAAVFREAKPVRFSLFLPSSRQDGADPILATGQGTRSDLVYCVYDRDNHVSFAIDHYGNGGPRSEQVRYDPLKPHTLVLWMGSFARGAFADRLFLEFDGRTLLNVRQDFYPGSAGASVAGFNAYGSSAAGIEFTGKILGADQVELSALPPPPRDSGELGAVEMSVMLPNNVPGTAEPLVVSGATGAGDMVYVKYLDATHIAIGFDHWGIGGSVGQPVEVDYGKVHRFAVSIDSLYPAGAPPRLKGVVRVKVDGTPALDVLWGCYPTRPAEVTIARNAIGGSTCGAAFTGRVLSIERFAQPRD